MKKIPSLFPSFQQGGKTFWTCAVSALIYFIFIRILANQSKNRLREDDIPANSDISPEKSEVKYIGRNMFMLKKACILPRRKGILILENFESDVDSVAACGGLFYQNEYGIRKLNVVFAKSSAEGSDFKWLSTTAEVILPSSTVSFWHFLHSLIPAFEFVIKGAKDSNEETYYFLENRVRADLDSCGGEKLYSDSSIIPLKLGSFVHNYSSDGIYDFFTSPFKHNVNVDELETLQCHEEVIIGSPLMVHHSTQEWAQILKKKERKMRQESLHYLGRDFFSIPVENGYQKEYATALKKKFDITECTCSGKPLLLFIKRKYTRRFVNEEEIEQIVHRDFKENFETKSIFLEKFTLLEQMKLFSCASVAVGAVGTGMTWIIFMREGASVILFQNHGRVQTELMERGVQVGRGGIFIPTYGTYTNFAHRGELHIQAWQPRSKVKGNWKDSDIFANTSDFRLMLKKSLLHVEAQERLSHMSCK